MTVEPGSHWRTKPNLIEACIVQALIQETTPGSTVIVCDTCGASWETDTYTDPDCYWCPKHRQAHHDRILKPPAPTNYGYATYGDLASLGIDPTQDHQNALERWRHDLQLAADNGLITEQEGEKAWQSANNPPKPSTSSTGTNSTTAPTTTKTPSSTASPTAAGGPPSPPQRKQGNRRSSLPSQWKPPNKATT